MTCHGAAAMAAGTGTLVVCTTGPTKVYRTEREDPRWCFGCRKRLGGTWTLWGETGETYYDPQWSYACDGCGQDRRWGFGCGPL